jgi:hypothetical protein
MCAADSGEQTSDSIELKREGAGNEQRLYDSYFPVSKFNSKVPQDAAANESIRMEIMSKAIAEAVVSLYYLLTFAPRKACRDYIKASLKEVLDLFPSEHNSSLRSTNKIQCHSGTEVMIMLVVGYWHSVRKQKLPIDGDVQSESLQEIVETKEPTIDEIKFKKELVKKINEQIREILENLYVCYTYPLNTNERGYNRVVLLIKKVLLMIHPLDDIEHTAEVIYKHINLLFRAIDEEEF